MQQQTPPASYKTPPIPTDSQNYFLSFDINTATDKQLQNFYHTYGVLVFRDVIGNEQIQRTIDDLWNNTIANNVRKGKNIIKRDDPDTWDYINGFHKAFGFVGIDILEEPQIWTNRKNPTIYKCFRRGYDAYLRKPLTEPLISCFDRGSLMLPGKLNKDWLSDIIYHFDIDPWAWTGIGKSANHPKYDYDPDRKSLLLGQNNYDPFVGYTKLAGVLALSDTNEESGGFQCACGFQNYIHQWCRDHKSYTSIEKDTNLVENFRKIFLRKGSLLIFSRQLPHNIYQNVSDKFRYAQYLRMVPFSSLCLTPDLEKARKELVRMLLPKNIDFSDAISKQIFMLEDQQLAAQQEKEEPKQPKQPETQNNPQNKPIPSEKPTTQTITRNSQTF